jgi:hypothetical protein
MAPDRIARTFYSLTFLAERRTEVDALISEPEKARDRASSKGLSREMCAGPG